MEPEQRSSVTSGARSSAEIGLPRVAYGLFLGTSPDWYKITIIGFLILNPIIVATAGPFIAGWLVLLQFIFTLALALKCYPLQPCGLLAIEAVAIGFASPQSVYHETEVNFPVILLLMFMVAGIYFLRDLLIYIFSKLCEGHRQGHRRGQPGQDQAERLIPRPAKRGGGCEGLGEGEAEP